MAADLHLHTVKDKTVEKNVRGYLKKEYWDSEKGNCDADENTLHYDEKVVDTTPDVWIGEVSWLKAALLEDKETFIPDPVQKVYDLIEDKLPILTEELKGKILDALRVTNKTQYEIANPKDVENFLNEHLGEKLFTISW